MYTYANKLNAAANQDKSEIILSFLQEVPCFEHSSDIESGATPDVKSQVAANIVMNEKLARSLAETILKMLNE